MNTNFLIKQLKKQSILDMIEAPCHSLDPILFFPWS